MARTKKVKADGQKVIHFQHEEEKRTNIPTAATAAHGKLLKTEKKRYYYNPHLPPVLRFDQTGQADRVSALLDKARSEPITAEEHRILSEALRNHQPWLEWTGKREAEGKGWFEIDPVALNIHERISTQAILRSARREDVQRDLFADPHEPWQEAVKFYQHDIDWTNRLILGDCLQVMSSLAHRENLAGKVQMIYIDPPYGIKYASNFQPEIGKKNVKETEENFSREVEMVKAYRDTWHKGIHSYLDYLRGRLELARDLLCESGSVFVQMSGDNIHRVRVILDETFGASNQIAQIAFRTKIPLGATFIAEISDYLLWYSKNRESTKFRRMFTTRESGAETLFSYVEEPTGHRRKISSSETTSDLETSGSAVFRGIDFVSSGRTETCVFDATFQGRVFRTASGKSWKTNPEGFDRLVKAERIVPGKSSLSYQFRHSDYPVQEYTNLWIDTQGATDKDYVVQTATKVIERCMLMTTDPGDLVLDPTCGAGTTAYVAEQWGRRWITIDTSRVALAIARQRIMTARFKNYLVRKPTGGMAENPGTGFIYETVPHITLKSIAQNTNLDPIFAKHEPILDAQLAKCNKALDRVPADLHGKLSAKLLSKQKAQGKRAITDADQRRWNFKKKFEHWEVPFDSDPDWPEELRAAVTAYRAAWQTKMDEVNACVAANADQEELVDKPKTVPGVRVSGPFSVEGVMSMEANLAEAAEEEEDGLVEGKNNEAYMEQMVRLLKVDGVTFKGNKIRRFAQIEPLWKSGQDLPWHAEGWWEGEDPSQKAGVGIFIGPQYGPVSALALEEVMRKAGRTYEELVVAGFSFDPEAVEIIGDGSSHPRLQVHQAFIRPDINPGMEGLLKEQPRSQLFTVFGQPDIEVSKNKDGEHVVTLSGVDTYDPLTGSIHSTPANKVAAWFVDTDYDGRCFCTTQAFFPDKDAWKKIAQALTSQADQYAFETLQGTLSIPFKAGQYGRVAVKVIDPRGNEVMVVRHLEP